MWSRLLMIGLPFYKSEARRRAIGGPHWLGAAVAHVPGRRAQDRLHLERLQARVLAEDARNDPRDVRRREAVAGGADGAAAPPRPANALQARGKWSRETPSRQAPGWTW